MGNDNAVSAWHDQTRILDGKKIEQIHRPAFNHQNIPGTNKKLANNPWPTTLNPQSKKNNARSVVISAKIIKKPRSMSFPVICTVVPQVKVYNSFSKNKLRRPQGASIGQIVT